MKKFVIMLLIVFLLLGGAVGYLLAKREAGDSGEPVALYDPENVVAAEPAETTETPETPADSETEEEEPEPQPEPAPASSPLPPAPVFP